MHKNPSQIQDFPVFDFPDFPRTDFSHYLNKKAKKIISEENFKKFEELNPKSNVFFRSF